MMIGFNGPYSVALDLFKVSSIYLFFFATLFLINTLQKEFIKSSRAIIRTQRSDVENTRQRDATALGRE